MAQGPLQPGSQIGADGPKAHKGHTLDLHKASLLFSLSSHAGSSLKR